MAVSAQGLAATRPAKIGPAALRRTIARLGVLQVDSVNVFERSHYLPLLARLGPYDRGQLDALLHHDVGRGLGDYTEYLAHEATVLPVSDWPLWAWHREASMRASFREWGSENAALVDEVRQEFGERGPLRELAWMRRLVEGAPREGEGHDQADARLCVACVPWAPVPAGPDVLERYLARAQEAAGDAAWRRVRGFRYLLQDKPGGTALQDSFIDALRLLGRKGYVFDLGVNQHERGRLQLEEAVEMIDRAHDGVEEDQKVVFILSAFVLSTIPPKPYRA